MATKFFSSWTDANTFQDLLALKSGKAFSTVVDDADAQVDALGDFKNICVTDDEELVALWRERGYPVGYISAGADPRYAAAANGETRP